VVVPPRRGVDADEMLRLRDAVAIAFPHGGISVAALRRYRDAGKLAVWLISGKEFTTLAAVEEMKALCRVDPKARASTFAKEPGAKPYGSSGTAAEWKSAQNAALAAAARLRASSKRISPPSTDPASKTSHPKPSRSPMSSTSTPPRSDP
jgi:hypothetical protein